MYIYIYKYIYIYIYTGGCYSIIYSNIYIYISRYMYIHTCNTGGCYDIVYSTLNNVRPSDRPDTIIQHMTGLVLLNFFMDGLFWLIIVGLFYQSCIICMLTLLLMPLAGLHFC
jgi:hypothetical protein